MTRTYTKREIAYILQCSVRTVEDDAAWLNLKPITGDRGRNLYSQVDFSLIQQMREHCQIPQNSRDSFVPQALAEVVENKPNVTTKLVRYKKTNLVKDNFRQSLSMGIATDPLFDLEILQRISNNHWLLPADRLALIFNISPKYLNSKQMYEYCGFIANKEAYSGGAALWKVTANNS